MNTIIIEGESNDNIQLIMALAKKLGAKVREITEYQKEDMALGNLMSELKTGVLIDEEDILKKLK